MQAGKDTLPWKHSKNGLPVYPAKHLHWMPWSAGIHSALSPHLSRAHGLKQTLFSLSHNSSGGQSSSYWHTE